MTTSSTKGVGIPTRTQSCDQEPVQETQPHSNAYYDEHRQRSRPSPLCQHHRQQHAKQSENRPDRQVYAAGDDYYSNAYAEDAKSADQSRHVLQIGSGKKARIENRNNDAQNNKQNEYAEFFFHQLSSASSKPRCASACCKSGSISCRM